MGKWVCRPQTESTLQPNTCSWAQMGWEETAWWLCSWAAIFTREQGGTCSPEQKLEKYCPQNTSRAWRTMKTDFHQWLGSTQWACLPRHMKEFYVSDWKPSGLMRLENIQANNMSGCWSVSLVSSFICCVKIPHQFHTVMPRGTSSLLYSHKTEIWLRQIPQRIMFWIKPLRLPRAHLKAALSIYAGFRHTDSAWFWPGGKSVN